MFNFTTPIALFISLNLKLRPQSSTSYIPGVFLSKKLLFTPKPLSNLALNKSFFEAQMNYSELAFEMMRPFVGDFFNSSELLTGAKVVVNTCPLIE